MSVGTLYNRVSEGESLRTRVILPTGLINYYKLDIKLSDPDSHYPSEFPARLVPSFRYANGDILTESVPIAFMLVDLIPNKGTLLGNGSAADKALILSWMNRFNNEFVNPMAVQLKIILGVFPASKQVWEACDSKVKRQAETINEYLTEHTYLVGETLTLADLYCAPMLFRPFTVVWGPEESAKYPAILRWFNTVKASPVLGGFFDNMKWAEKAPTPDLK